MLSSERKHYKRNFKIAIVVSELLVICAFLFSPRSSISEKVLLYDEPIILINEIPQTVQKNQMLKRKPEVPIIYIPNDIDALEILDDVEQAIDFEEKVAEETIISSNSTNHYMNHVPRQTLEVMPSIDKKDFEGQLQLSLKINERGEVIAHKILLNSLNCSDCLNQIISAAYNSRWEAGIINGKKSDYWVKKSYVFN